MAASLKDRNVRISDDLNIKPTLQMDMDSSLYKPNKYLNSRKEHLDMGNTQLEASSTYVNRLLNMRKSNKESTLHVPLVGGFSQADEQNYVS